MLRSILLIDDDPALLDVLGRFFTRRGWDVARAIDGTSGLELHERQGPDVVLLDLQLPVVGGLSVLEALRARDPDAAVVILTGHGDIASAVEAMRLGAENFLTKPVELEHLEAVAERTLEKVALRRRNRFLAERQGEAPGLDQLGESRVMRDIARQVELLARTDSTVLLQGESGTGKGWTARMVHELSGRRAGPFVEINCAGLTATFLESELFGHEKGAFTDARTQKRGLFEVADGGTLFLDEIGDLAPELQPKFLKALESRRFRRLGGTREIEVDVRLVAASNRDLGAAATRREFREDLYYRLAVLPLRLPSLRERGRDDLEGLAMRLLLDLRRRAGRGPARLTPEALSALVSHSWPGNIRELRNVLERVVLLAGEVDEIQLGHLPAELARAGAGAALPVEDPGLSLAEVERRHISRVLAHNGGNRSRTARALGIARATLYEKLRRYHLE